MASRHTHLGVLLLALTFQAPAASRAQGSQSWSGCKTDSLSNYNCAQYYSGTVSLSSELKTPSGTEARSVVATITAGHVACRVKQPEGSAFEGPGMLVAEHAGTGNAGKYVIKVWCPEAAGSHPTRGDTPMIDTYDQQAASYAVLEGKDAHAHPDADAANGVSGTETVTWSLRR
jgi:hypothetical protein